MGDKSVRKQKYIVEKARDVFAEKGYRVVTMKDIVDACEISRGGLYIYFASTRELFLEVLKLDSNDEDSFAGKVTDKSTPTEILVLFLAEQKKDILRKKGSLAKAIYEFYFEGKPDKKDDNLRKDYDDAVQLLQKLIEVGVSNGEMTCQNPHTAALNIIFTLEGMRITANTVGLTAESVDKQLMYILSTLGIDDV